MLRVGRFLCGFGILGICRFAVVCIVCLRIGNSSLESILFRLFVVHLLWSEFPLLSGFLSWLARLKDEFCISNRRFVLWLDARTFFSPFLVRKKMRMKSGGSCTSRAEFCRKDEETINFLGRWDSRKFYVSEELWFCVLVLFAFDVCVLFAFFGRLCLCAVILTERFWGSGFLGTLWLLFCLLLCGFWVFFENGFFQFLNGFVYELECFLTVFFGWLAGFNKFCWV